ncbi:hypothetical protein ABFS82_10G073800 [Erythranthe guttata]
MSPIRIVLLVIFLLHFAAAATAASSVEPEADILIAFKNSLDNADALSSWVQGGSPPCNGDQENWVGIFCENGTVWGLQLQNLELEGVIDVDVLAKLPNLRTMSFMNNKFDGSLPNLSKLTNMKSIYLSNNAFSGEISPSTFSGMESLKKLHLANNQFTGQIPASLIVLKKLKELMLENNQFEGEIPQFPAGLIRTLNVSNNKLIGEIPLSLSNFPASSFDGNKILCGAPLALCPPKQHLTLGSIIIVSILVAAASSALILVVFILRRRKQIPQPPEAAAAAYGHQKRPDLDNMETGQLSSVPGSGSSSPEKLHHHGGGGGKKSSEPSVKITFLKEDRVRFDMTDLLKASAEILGSGVFGSTYKAALNKGQVMVVKRFRHMNNVDKGEFHEHMRRLGRLSHPNVLPIVGFYYRKEEKLLVTDYAEKVSLAVHLHGNRSQSRPCPDWPTRLKIVKGVARGLMYLYNELPSLTAPHGHLKSSNVLLDGSYTPLLADYGLVPVVNQEHAQEHMISYKSPEYKSSGRITKKTDVWSLGILILETLTGRFPSNFLQHSGGGGGGGGRAPVAATGDVDVAAWVEAAVGDDGDNVEVLDADMERDDRSVVEMMKLLNIGLSCCQVDVDIRPDIKEAVERIEEVKEY